MNKINIKHGFAFKLSLYVITSIIIIFFFVLSYNYYVTKNTILNDIKKYMQILASSAIDKMDSGLSDTQQIAEDLAYVLEYANPAKNEPLHGLKPMVSDLGISVTGLRPCQIMPKEPSVYKQTYGWMPFIPSLKRLGFSGML